MMKATYIDHMGTDLSVVNAARVSFAKSSEWKLDAGGEEYLSKGDRGLIRFLARNNHWTPFGHTAVTMHFKAPIFVARQLGKSQVGLVWNEVSRRYVNDTPEFYEPDGWRKAAENVKQGSSDELVTRPLVRGISTTYSREALRHYESLLQAGVCAEQARMVLPQSMMTEWYWTGSIAAFSRVYGLRVDSHTQRETQQVARQIGEIIEPLFPVSWEALTQ